MPACDINVNNARLTLVSHWFSFPFRSFCYVFFIIQFVLRGLEVLLRTSIRRGDGCTQMRAQPTVSCPEAAPGHARCSSRDALSHSSRCRLALYMSSGRKEKRQRGDAHEFLFIRAMQQCAGSRTSCMSTDWGHSGLNGTGTHACNDSLLLQAIGSFNL